VAEKREKYDKPSIEKLGSVAKLTLTGLTHPGADAKSGSRPSQGG
jgi:hypothetical protein